MAQDQSFRFLTHDEVSKLGKSEKIEYLNRAIDVLEGQGSWQAPFAPLDAEAEAAQD